MGNTYWGEFTLSIPTSQGERYLTMANENALCLPGNSGDRSAFRLYRINDGWALVTRFLDGYESQNLRLDIQPVVQATGQGKMDGKHPKQIGFMMERRIDPEGGTTNLLVLGSGSPAFLLLGSAKGFYVGKDDYLYLGDPTSMFRPNPWTFRRVRGFDERGVSLRGLNLSSLDRMKVKWSSCDLRNAYWLKTAFFESDFSDSNFESSGIFDVVFEPGCKLDRTVWKSSQLLSVRLDQCSCQNADFRESLLAYPEFLHQPAFAASLKGADLRGAKFCGCELREVDFTQADLRGADFTGATFNKTILNGAKLGGASFNNANMRDAVFTGELPKFYEGEPKATDRKATFAGATLPAALLGRDWSLLDLTRANLLNVPTDLANLKAQYAILPSMDLTGRTLTAADFTGSTITDMKFDGANLTNAKLPGVDLRTVTFDRATVTGMDISGADLTGCDLQTVIATVPPITSKGSTKRTVLARAKLKAGLLGKDWSYVNLNDATLFDIPSTDLRGINAAYVELTGVDLTGANFNPETADKKSVFRGALFHGATLQRTQFRQANLAGAQFGQLRTAFRMPLPESAAGSRPAELRGMLTGAGFSGSARVNFEPVEDASGTLLQSGSSDTSEEFFVRVHRFADGNAELHVVQSTQPADLSKAYLVDADLTGANLEGATANEAHLYGDKTKLSGALMSRIRLVDANLGTADLQDAQLRGATLRNANLVGAKLMRADLTPYGDSAADLSGAYLSGADFTDAKLNGALLTDAAVSTSNGAHLFTLNANARSELAAGRSFLLAAASFDNYLKALTTSDKAFLKELLEEESDETRVVITTAATIAVVSQAAIEWKIETLNTSSKVLNVTLDKETRTSAAGVPTTVMVLNVRAEGTTEKKSLPNTFLPSYIMALNTKQPAILEPAFRDLGWPLGPTPNFTMVKQVPATWRVSESVSGVDLMFWTRAFDLGMRGMRVQSPHTALRAFFAANQQPLIERAEISSSAVDNDWGNTAALTPGYVYFNVIEGEVFGAQLRIRRLGANDRLEAAVIPMNDPTILPSSSMDANTRWPNGRTTSKQDPDSPRDTWLWGSKLPTPPRCVPSMHGYCPPEI
jgi:uncharacterized protein YjbI with pentapeptide repeats